MATRAILLSSLISGAFAFDQCRSAACYNAIIDQDLGPSVGYVPASKENDCIAFQGASATVTQTGVQSTTVLEEVGYTDTATIYTYSSALARPRKRALKRGVRPSIYGRDDTTLASSLPASSSTEPTIPAYATSACPASSDYAAACSCAGITPTTTTVPYSTTSVVATSTYSESYYPTARVLTTLPACVQSSDYGMQQGSIQVNNYHVSDLPAPVTRLAGALSAEDCCQACFAGANDGCIFFSFDATISNATCSLSIADSGVRCPQGPGGSEAKLIAANSGPLVGFGPCVREVDVFIQY